MTNKDYYKEDLKRWEEEKKIHKFLIIKIRSFLSKYLKIGFIKEIRNIERFIEGYLGNDLIGVEIGVYDGFHAKTMLKKYPIKTRYLIDPYTSCDDYFDWQKKVIRKSELKAVKMLRHFRDRVTFIMKKSEDAVNNIPDNLDFVNIDGNLRYEFVKKDIELYYPKLREGGVLAGNCKGKPLKSRGASLAVIEFISKIKPKIFKFDYDWAIIKRK